MSKPKLAAVVATISDRRSARDPSNRAVFLFEVDQHYSLDAVQRFLDLNEAAFGGRLRARHELARFKNLRRLFAWTDRKRPGSPVALRGWTGPLRLGPADRAGRTAMVERIKSARDRDEDAHFCIACDRPLKDGDPYYEDINEGPMHAECCGPEPESFVDANGDPLKPGDPIPAPSIYWR